MDDIQNFGKGALAEKKDIWRPTLKRHIKKFGASVLPASFDLTSLYSQFPVYNQGPTEACSGFAFGHYAEVKTLQRDGAIVTLSKKDIYQNIFQPGGGAYGKDAINYVINQGVCFDSEIPTGMLVNGLLSIPDEKYMETIIPRNSQAQADGLKHTFSNVITFNGQDINEIKQAILNGDGAICALWGNNQCWLTNNGIVEIPGVPPGDASLWGHFLILIGWDDSTGLIKCKSSWGDQVGSGGYFFIPYAYFTKGYSMSEYTLVELPANYVPTLTQKTSDLIYQIISLLKLEINELSGAFIK